MAGEIIRFTGRGRGAFGGRRGSPPRRITAGVPLPCFIPRKLKVCGELPVLHDPRSLVAERFHALKAELEILGPGPRVITVTSSLPGEGRSLVAANLALALAARPQGKTLLVDADLRRPAVQALLRPAPTIGLAELLADETTIEHVLLDVENSALRILPAGQVPDGPLDLLCSTRFGELLVALQEHFDRIVIDTPPVLTFADAKAVAARSDGVVLVVRVRRTARRAYLAALGELWPARILGVVRNDSRRSLADRVHLADRGAAEYYEDR